MAEEAVTCLDRWPYKLMGISWISPVELGLTEPTTQSYISLYLYNYSNIIELSNATPTKPITMARPTAYYITDNSYYSAYSPNSRN